MENIHCLCTELLDDFLEIKYSQHQPQRRRIIQQIHNLSPLSSSEVEPVDGVVCGNILVLVISGTPQNIKTLYFLSKKNGKEYIGKKSSMSMQLAD